LVKKATDALAKMTNFASDSAKNESSYSKSMPLPPSPPASKVAEQSLTEMPKTAKKVKLSKQEKREEKKIVKSDVKVAEKKMASAAKGSWTVCAEEGGDCKCHGTVLYGRKYWSERRKTKATVSQLRSFPHKTMIVSGTAKCSNSGIRQVANAGNSASKGSDPDKGRAKHCMCREETAGETDRARKRRDQKIAAAATPKNLLSKSQETQLAKAERKLVAQDKNPIPGLAQAAKRAKWSSKQNRRFEAAKKIAKEAVHKKAHAANAPMANPLFDRGFAAGHQAGMKKKCGTTSTSSRRLLAPMPPNQRAHLLTEERSDLQKAAEYHDRAAKIAALLKRDSKLTLPEQMTLETQPGLDDFRLAVAPQGPQGRGEVAEDSVLDSSLAFSQDVGDSKGTSADRDIFHRAFHAGFLSAMSSQCPQKKAL